MEVVFNVLSMMKDFITSGDIWIELLPYPYEKPKIEVEFDDVLSSKKEKYTFNEPNHSFEDNEFRHHDIGVETIQSSEQLIIDGLAVIICLCTILIARKPQIRLCAKKGVIVALAIPLLSTIMFLMMGISITQLRYHALSFFPTKLVYNAFIALGPRTLRTAICLIPGPALINGRLGIWSSPLGFWLWALTSPRGCLLIDVLGLTKFMPGPGYSNSWSYSTWKLMKLSYNSNYIYDKPDAALSFLQTVEKVDSEVQGGVESTNVVNLMLESVRRANNKMINGILDHGASGQVPLVISPRVTCCRAVYLYILPYYPIVAALLEVEGSLIARVLGIYFSLRQGIYLVRLLANFSGVVLFFRDKLKTTMNRFFQNNNPDPVHINPVHAGPMNDGGENNANINGGADMGWLALGHAARSLKLMFARDLSDIVLSIGIAIWWNHVLWPLFPLNLLASYNDWELLQRDQLIIDYLLIMLLPMKLLLEPFALSGFFTAGQHGHAHLLNEIIRRREEQAEIGRFREILQRRREERGGADEAMLLIGVGDLFRVQLNVDGNVARRRADGNNANRGIHWPPPLEVSEEERRALDQLSSETGIIPDFLRCSITHEVMLEPAVVNGHCFERAGIELWLSTHRHDPVSRQQCTPKDLRPDYQMRECLSFFLEQLRSGKFAHLQDGKESIVENTLNLISTTTSKTSSSSSSSSSNTDPAMNDLMMRMTSDENNVGAELRQRSNPKRKRKKDMETNEDTLIDDVMSANDDGDQTQHGGDEGPTKVLKHA